MQQNHLTHYNNANHSSGSYKKEKAAHNVEMGLKNNDQKFSGDLIQCWQDFVDNYEQVAENYDYSEKQNLKYLHNLLSKDAHRYYLEKVKPNVTNYIDAMKLIEKEYNSVV